MTHPLVVALEDAFQLVRDQDVPLNERLAAIAACVRERGPDFAAAVDAFVARLERARAGDAAPRVGEAMPGFNLPDQDGRLVSLHALLARGPVVIVFHRGHWCPYCRLNMVGLTEIEEAVRPAQIVAISSETQRYTSALRAEAGAHFPFLSDIGGGYALALNLAIHVDDEMAALIAGAGWTVPAYQGGGGWMLPVPSVFIVGRDGIIAARHIDPDYRRRMELDVLLSGVDRVRGELARPVGRAHQVEERPALA